jgi:tetratricopeptide (TPR) repeat protein
MPALKPLAPGHIPGALQKAAQYRLLGEPCEAESICLDALAAEPRNHEAQIMLILSLTDQFRTALSQIERVTKLAAELDSPYEQAYYSGIVRERLGKAQLTRGGPGSDAYATSAIREAMAWYERAERLRPAGNDDALLRWNTCVRTLERWNLASRTEEPMNVPLMLE